MRQIFHLFDCATSHRRKNEIMKKLLFISVRQLPRNSDDNVAGIRLADRWSDGTVPWHVHHHTCATVCLVNTNTSSATVETLQKMSGCFQLEEIK